MTYLLHHHVLSFHHYLLRSKTSRAIVALTLRTLSAGLITLFLPLYLLNSGYSFATVALYFMGVYFFKLFTHAAVVWSVKRFGVSHALLMSYIFSALFALSLTLAQTSFTWLMISLLLMSLMKSFYWDARHIDLADLFDREKMVKQTSLLFILNAVVAAMSPMLGGLLTEYASATATLLVATVSYLLAAVILVKDWQEENHHNKFSNEGEDKPRTYIRDLIANFAMNYQSVTFVFLWPIMLYLMDLDFSEVGLVLSFGLAFGLAINWYFSSHALNHISVFVVLGLGLSFVFNLVVPFATGITALVALSVLREAGSALYGSPYTALFYRNAREHGITNYIANEERAGDAAKILMWLPMLLLSANPLLAVQISFLSAAALTPVAYLLTNNDDKSEV